jgi:hydroxymethylpyrimidine pyrophosphatase-like HAD family hydrolase
MTVSFDYDGTLTRPDVQRYARRLVQRGFNVMIHTNRPATYTKGVFETASRVGIPFDNIRFCNQEKELFLDSVEYIFHLDDDITTACRNLVFCSADFERECELKINQL